MADTINFTTLGLTGTGLVVQNGAKSFNKFSVGSPGFVVQKSDGTCIVRSLIGGSGISIVNATGSGGDANFSLDSAFSPTFNGMTLNNGLTLPAGGTALTYYEEGTHNTNWSGPWASRAGNITYRRIGRIVILSIPDTRATATTPNNITNDTALPAQLIPPALVYPPSIRVRDAATDKFGLVQINTSGIVTFGADAGFSAFTGSGNTGLYPMTITYIV